MSERSVENVVTIQEVQLHKVDCIAVHTSIETQDVTVCISAG